MIRAVFLDLDETLVAQERAFELAYEAVARLAAEAAGVDGGSVAAAIPATADDCLGGLQEAEFVRRCRFGGRDLLWGDPGEGDSAVVPSEALRRLGEVAAGYRLAVWSSLLEKLGAGSTELCGRLDECFRREMERGVEAFPEVADVVERLSSRYRLGVITNGLPLAQRRKLERLRMAGYFEILVASAEVGIGKPDPEIFRYALRGVQVEAGDALMVGDSLEGDVRGAQQAGMKAIWLRRRSDIHAGRETDVQIASDFKELEAVLDLDSSRLGL